MGRDHYHSQIFVRLCHMFVIPLAFNMSDLVISSAGREIFHAITSQNCYLSFGWQIILAKYQLAYWAIYGWQSGWHWWQIGLQVWQGVRPGDVAKEPWGRRRDWIQRSLQGSQNEYVLDKKEMVKKSDRFKKAFKVTTLSIKEIF